MSASYHVVHQHYVAARRKVLGGGWSIPGDDLSHQQGTLRRISIEFHKRLKRAGIHVEQAPTGRARS